MKLIVSETSMVLRDASLFSLLSNFLASTFGGCFGYVWSIDGGPIAKRANTPVLCFIRWRMSNWSFELPSGKLT